MITDRKEDAIEIHDKIYECADVTTEPYLGYLQEMTEFYLVNDHEYERLKNIGEEVYVYNYRIKDVKNLIEKVAESDLTVLITGENGIGKELVAKEIYKKSDRRKNNYIVVSCASMPEETMERELFGFERGAFTGANSSKKGLLEEADGGTMFLDDISAMDIKLKLNF
mgnify:CR=1 FL=1